MDHHGRIAASTGLSAYHEKGRVQLPALDNGIENLFICAAIVAGTAAFAWLVVRPLVAWLAFN
ncbi:MAG: hypothetical protein A3A33_03000 [Candidatus Yanofskybacteria bacterium RIFCSPLOWO2_01_FULL_49_25]|uniref:Uncharacterized protein n=1 Tax=Candidatus Yanofskybacteria bacterium RIFCSPLOWO2_01_FULL_49_25 TaxID=1802701 RepID=A0A1F8GT16_9BACT|nr:MAG: hypothetical protein A3A33_03000 [Candidatus Yanofskybacteria bacterium RIFCSPLOWO2_01_FULL_49_25]